MLFLTVTIGDNQSTSSSISLLTASLYSGLFCLCEQKQCKIALAIIVHVSKMQRDTALLLGHWQVPVANKDQSKTTFSSPMVLFQLKIMPFGLKKDPATLQRLMDCITQRLEEFTHDYRDNTLKDFCSAVASKYLYQ